MNHSAPSTFADEVRAIPGGENLELCYSCGTCVSKCMIQQKVEPEYNPRRLLRLVMMGEKEAAFTSPTTWMCSKCDLCYTACPQQIHISGVISAVKQLAIKAGYQSPLEVVEVDEKSCSGCAVCVMVCPYGAPHLVEKKVKGKNVKVSQIDPNLCMRCGTCVAACPLGAVSRPGISNEDLRKQLPKVNQESVKPQLLTLVCDWCLRETSDLNLLENQPANIKVIHIPCSGRIDPQLALLALKSGIDGVLVCGCKEGECHFIRGNFIGGCKLNLLNDMFSQSQMPAHKVKFVKIGTQERGRIQIEINKMIAQLAEVSA